MKNKSIQYNTILLKISGEALLGKTKLFDMNVISHVVDEIASIYKYGLKIGIVIGGGNIVRGRELTSQGFDRNQSDYMGMLATLINSLLFENALTQAGIPSVVQSALEIPTVIDNIDLKKTVRYLEAKRVILFAGGTGSPYFTTDTAAALRACEINADLLLKATKVDGVYERDPVKYPNAKIYTSLSYQEVLERNLGVMDMAAVSLCREKKIPIVVFNLFKKGSIVDIVSGTIRGTLIKE